MMVAHPINRVESRRTRKEIVVSNSPFDRPSLSLSAHDAADRSSSPPLVNWDQSPEPFETRQEPPGTPPRRREPAGQRREIVSVYERQDYSYIRLGTYVPHVKKQVRIVITSMLQLSQRRETGEGEKVRVKR